MPPWPGRACARLVSTLLILELGLGPTGPGPSPASGWPTPLAGTPGPGRAPASLANLLRVENAEHTGLKKELRAGLEEPAPQAVPSGPGMGSFATGKSVMQHNTVWVTTPIEQHDPRHFLYTVKTFDIDRLLDLEGHRRVPEFYSASLISGDYLETYWSEGIGLILEFPDEDLVAVLTHMHDKIAMSPETSSTLAGFLREHWEMSRKRGANNVLFDAITTSRTQLRLTPSQLIEQSRQLPPPGYAENNELIVRRSAGLHVKAVVLIARTESKFKATLSWFKPSTGYARVLRAVQDGLPVVIVGERGLDLPAAKQMFLRTFPEMVEVSPYRFVMKQGRPAPAAPTTRRADPEEPRVEQALTQSRTILERIATHGILSPAEQRQRGIATHGSTDFSTPSAMAQFPWIAVNVVVASAPGRNGDRAVAALLSPLFGSLQVVTERVSDGDSHTIASPRFRSLIEERARYSVVALIDPERSHPKDRVDIARSTQGTHQTRLEGPIPPHAITTLLVPGASAGVVQLVRETFPWAEIVTVPQDGAIIPISRVVHREDGSSEPLAPWRIALSIPAYVPALTQRLDQLPSGGRLVVHGIRLVAPSDIAPPPAPHAAGLEEPASPAGEALDANAILARADDHQRMSRQQAVGSLAQIRSQDRRRNAPGERGRVNQQLYQELLAVIEAEVGRVSETLRERALNHVEELSYVGDDETIGRLRGLLSRADFGDRLRGAVTKALHRLGTNVARATKGRTVRLELTNTMLNASLQELVRALEMKVSHVELAQDSQKDHIQWIDFAEYLLQENRYIVYRAEQRGGGVHVYRKDARVTDGFREGERIYPQSTIRLVDIRGNTSERVSMEEFERADHQQTPPTNQGIFAHTHVTFELVPGAAEQTPPKFMGHIFELQGTLSLQLTELKGIRLLRLFDEIRPSEFEERVSEYPNEYPFRGFDPIKIIPDPESRVAHPISDADQRFLTSKGIRYSVEPESVQSTTDYRVSGIGAFVGGLGIETYREYLLSGSVNVRNTQATSLELRVEAGDEEGVMDRRVMGLEPESDLANMALGEWFVFDPDGHTITFVRLDDYDGKQNMIHALTAPPAPRAGLEEPVARAVAVVEAAQRSSVRPHVVIVDAAAPRTPQLAALLAALQHSPTIGPHLLMFDARYPMDEQLAAPLLAMSWKTSSPAGTVMFLSGDGRRAMQMERLLKTLFGSDPPFLQLRGILTVANLLIGLDVPPSTARQLEDELAARLEQREAVESGA